MTDKQMINDKLKNDVACKENIINHLAEHNIKLQDQLQRKAQSEAILVGQIQIICDFINNRPETFKGIYGGVDKIITEYASCKEQECETLASQLDFEVQKKECLEQECEELKTALTEIKEIIHFNKNNRLSGGAYISIEQILQKISECEVENEYVN